MRTPPRSTKALYSSLIYSIHKQQGTKGATYYLETIARMPCTVLNYSGYFVRFANGLWRLHDETELPRVIRKLKKEGSLVVLDSEYFNVRKHKARPFILLYEKRIGAYS